MNASKASPLVNHSRSFSRNSPNIAWTFCSTRLLPGTVATTFGG